MKKNSKHKEESNYKNRLSHLGKGIGKNNKKWRGNKVGYGALHDWIKNHYGKASKCENNSCLHISETYDWANISGKYKREISDWKQLCRSCHKKIDWKPKIYCIRRHRLEGNNLSVNNRGNRVCKKCKSICARKNYEKDKSKVINRVKKWREIKKLRTTILTH